MRDFRIAPSILSADFARLGEEVDAVLKAGADMIHFDVMDNHYVPNLTIGPVVCEALRKHGVKAPIDVHLMVKPVDRLIGDFAKAGATYITFHPEASEHVDRSLQLIHSSGCKAGLVFNPATTLNHLQHVMDKLDMILIMSVNPGFAGQSFISTSLDKLRAARALMSEAEIADRLADNIVAAVKLAHPAILVTSNVGCSLHLRAALQRHGLTIPVLHPLELLAMQLPDDTSAIITA